MAFSLVGAKPISEPMMANHIPYSVKFKGYTCTNILVSQSGHLSVDGIVSAL